MLNAINTKLLLAILVALTVIGSAALYQRDQAAKTAAAAAKAAAILQMQRDDDEYAAELHLCLRILVRSVEETTLERVFPRHMLHRNPVLCG